MPEIICEECGKRLYHENQDTLKIEDAIHKKFCRKQEGETFSYMHKDDSHNNSMDPERVNDMEGKPVQKK